MFTWSVAMKVSFEIR